MYLWSFGKFCNSAQQPREKKDVEQHRTTLKACLVDLLLGAASLPKHSSCSTSPLATASRGRASRRLSPPCSASPSLPPYASTCGALRHHSRRDDVSVPVFCNKRRRRSTNLSPKHTEKLHHVILLCQLLFSFVGLLVLRLLKEGGEHTFLGLSHRVWKALLVTRTKVGERQPPLRRRRWRNNSKQVKQTLLRSRVISRIRFFTLRCFFGGIPASGARRRACVLGVVRAMTPSNE